MESKVVHIRLPSEQLENLRRAARKRSYQLNESVTWPQLVREGIDLVLQTELSQVLPAGNEMGVK